MSDNLIITHGGYKVNLSDKYKDFVNKFQILK